ncbi:MAG: primosomal protein N' [Pseudohongiella sp.]|nr:MAG: primosomal protein N' [Pseudohongiella sp.]
MSVEVKANYRGKVLEVAVPSPLRRVFDYLPLPDQDTLPGTRVKVSFGRQKLIGIVTAVKDSSNLTARQLKPILASLDNEPLFGDAIFKILLWAANYYQHPIGEVFAAALPSKLRGGIPLREEIKFWSASEASEAEEELLGRAVKQKALLDHIRAVVELDESEFRESGFGRQLLQQLLQKNLIEERVRSGCAGESFKPIEREASFELELNEEQTSAVIKIGESLGGYECFLLDGITGSGKTEVYMRIMHEQLSKGLQCLVLVPEIGLTPQTIARFECRFSCPVVSLHSGLNETERMTAWTRARDGSAGIVIGTRSAVFTPLAKPGLIVIDEEHDSSLKQQDGFRYSARDLAVSRAREENICIVLGTATPSLESLHNARSQKFVHLRLTKRTGADQSSKMEVIDVANEKLDEGFSEQLLYRIRKHIEQGNQVLVFINRRGFAPILNCQNCGWICECENCITQFTVHANPPSIRCHHCGAAARLPRSCPNCKSKELNTMGIGTQRIETFLQKKFSDTAVIRIDRDSTRRKHSLEKMLEEINKGEPCILLGTQMLAKGHHFPNITLVAILDADSGLFSADFRGQEHMGQTMVQVAGRAGRADRPGEVVIQSRHASHETLQSLATRSYAEFSDLQLEERMAARLPPFSHLCLLRAEANEMRAALQLLERIAEFCRRFCEHNSLPIEQLGPLPSPMEKRAGKYRVQLLLKTDKRAKLQALLSHLCVELESMKLPRSVRFSIDVDPQDLV